MQGDQVLVELEPPQGRRTPAWAALRACWSGAIRPWWECFTTRGRTASRETMSVIPFDERMTQPILIPPGEELPAAHAGSTPHRVLGAEAVASSET